MAATPMFPSSVFMEGVELTNADGTAAKDFFAVVPNDVRIDMIGASSDDTASRDVTIILNDGTSDRLAFTALVATGAGMSSAVGGADMMNRTNSPWVNEDGAIFLKAGWKLRVQAPVAVTAAKAIRLTAIGGVLI